MSRQWFEPFTINLGPATNYYQLLVPTRYFLIPSFHQINILISPSHVLCSVQTSLKYSSKKLPNFQIFAYTHSESKMKDGHIDTNRADKVLSTLYNFTMILKKLGFWIIRGNILKNDVPKYQQFFLRFLSKWEFNVSWSKDILCKSLTFFRWNESRSLRYLSRGHQKLCEEIKSKHR